MCLLWRVQALLPSASVAARVESMALTIKYTVCVCFWVQETFAPGVPGFCTVAFPTSSAAKCTCRQLSKTLSHENFARETAEMSDYESDAEEAQELDLSNVRSLSCSWNCSQLDCLEKDGAFGLTIHNFLSSSAM
jgi:hypothetical protein